MSKKILKGRWFAKQNSPLHSLEKQEKKRDFSKNVLQIKHLQLGKFPYPQKSPNGEFGGFWRISALQNADFSNSPFCRNRDKSLQFNLKYRYKKSRMACHHTALRQKNGGGFKEKIKYPFSGLFQNIITKIHTIFLQVQPRDFPAPNRYFVYVIPLLKIFASFDSFRHFYTRTGIFLLNQLDFIPDRW